MKLRLLPVLVEWVICISSVQDIVVATGELNCEHISRKMGMVEGRTCNSSEQYSPNLKMKLGPEIVQVRIVVKGVDWIGRKRCLSSSLASHHSHTA